MNYAIDVLTDIRLALEDILRDPGTQIELIKGKYEDVVVALEVLDNHKSYEKRFTFGGK